MFGNQSFSGFSFDASKYQPLGFDPIPDGEYVMTVTDATITPTKDGQGAYIKFKWQVNGGQFDGRVVFQNVTIRNANDTAVSIGMSTLTSMCNAMGIPGVSSEKEFVGRQTINKVTVRKSEGYADQNNIVAYKSVNAAVNTAFSAPQNNQSTMQPPAQPNVVSHPAPTPVQHQPMQQMQPHAPQQPQHTAPWQQGAPQPWQQPADPQPVQQAPTEHSSPTFGAVPPWVQQG